jgi:two-component system LytT family response regulator
LLFLDIKMPGGSGFDLLARLERVPRVIFTTAHDQHAVRAFEVNALDYLLKPVEPERLAAALLKARNSGPPGSAQGAVLEQLFVQDGPRCWFVPLREVRLLSAENNYVRLWWGKLQPLIARPLSTIERRLDPKKFFRANRSQIINLEFIEKVDLGINGRLDVTLRTGGPEVEISRRQARLFREQMSI